MWNSSSSAWTKLQIRGRQESFPIVVLGSSNLTSGKGRKIAHSWLVVWRGAHPRRVRAAAPQASLLFWGCLLTPQSLSKGRTKHLCRKLRACGTGTLICKKACAEDMQRKNKSCYSNSLMPGFHDAEIRQHQIMLLHPSYYTGAN